MSTSLARIAVQTAAIDVAGELARLSQLGGIGAVASFVGICRDEAGRVAALELEHYPGMAESKIAEIANQALARWGLAGLTVVHRSGRLKPGDVIVFVGAASPHRDAAFRAAEFVIDYLKTDAPFWKKEHAADGSAPRWVEARASDNAAAERWRPPPEPD